MVATPPGEFSEKYFTAENGHVGDDSREICKLSCEKAIGEWRWECDRETSKRFVD